MTNPDFGNSFDRDECHRTKVLDDVPVLCYKHEDVKQRRGADENMGKEPNFDLGEQPLKVDSGLTLDPRLVRLVQALARHRAEKDFEALIGK